jgi:stage II sporulation protein R
MKIKKWEIALIAALLITTLSGFVLSGTQEELSDKLIRLHVVANSDSAYDQSMKLEIRDGVLDVLGPLLENVQDRSEAEVVITEHLDTIQSAAQKRAQSLGYNCTIHTELKQENFPTRDYETFSLPAGEYLSLRVDIGDGDGKNWWCVVFPSLCTEIAGSTDIDFAETGLTEDEVSLITRDSPKYEIKFQIIEWLGELKNLF